MRKHARDRFDVFRVAGAGHNTFTDMALTMPSQFSYEIDPMRGVEVNRGIVRACFDQYLRGETSLDDFELLHEVLEAAPFEEWRAFFVAGCTPSLPEPSTPVLVHCDLASEHVLYDAGRQEITGIIDWSEIAVSDRSVDLAGFFHWGGQACIDAVLHAYEGQLDETVLVRARFLAACRGVADIAFGLTMRRQEYI